MIRLEHFDTLRLNDHLQIVGGNTLGFSSVQMFAQFTHIYRLAANHCSSLYVANILGVQVSKNFGLFDLRTDLRKSNLNPIIKNRATFLGFLKL